MRGTRRPLAILAALALAAGVASLDAQDAVPKGKTKPPAKSKAPAGDKAAKAPVRTVRLGPHAVGVGVAPNDALTVALADSDPRTLSPDDAPFTRYVWVADGDHETMRAMALTANYPSHASVIVRPLPVTGGAVLLLRVDLRRYAPRPEELADFLRLWEEYRNDPKFSTLLTRDVLAGLTFADGQQIPVVKVRKVVERKQLKAGHEQQWRTERRAIGHRGGDFAYPDDSGRTHAGLASGTYTFDLRFKVGEPPFEVLRVEEVVEVKLTDVKDVDLVRLPGKHIDPAAYATLCDRLRTEAPIVSHDYWMCRHLATIKGKGLFKELYGGLYYDFMRFKRDQPKGTDEDHILEGLGLGSVELGLTAEKLFDRIRSDQRAAVFKSGVTGKPRRTDFLRSPTGRDGSGLVSITHDLFDESVDVGQHPLMNLIKVRDDGREGIAEQANGLHKFWITDGAGKLADVAPPNLVADHTIPAPHTRQLQSAISCIKCHGQGRDDGWKPVANDVKRAAGKRLDVFGDKSQARRPIDDTLDRLAGLYAGDPELKLLPRGRDDYAGAVLRATGPWPGSKDQADVVNLASARLGQVWNDRNYKQVDARQALAELGVIAAEKDAPAILGMLLPPSVEDAAFGVVPEDVRIGALVAGVPINRTDWDLVYGFATARAQRTMKALLEKPK